MSEAPRITLIGAPVESGAGRGGCLMGPAALRTAGLAGTLADLGCEVADRGDLRPAAPFPPIPAGSGLARMHHAAEVAAWTQTLSAAVHEVLAAGRVPVVLGGDHSLAMGSVNAAARHARALGRPLFVLWLDAHSDFNTPETSPSGNLHGVPAAFLCGEPGLDALIGDEPREPIDPARLHLLGIRSVDRHERGLLAARGVDVVDMRAIDEFGVAVPMRRILERVAAENGMLHVSLDVDFLDPTIAPGVGTVVPGGATYREAHLVLEMLHDSGAVTSLDLVELNPYLDDRGMTARLLVDLVASLFGRRIIDRPPQAGRMRYSAD